LTLSLPADSNLLLSNEFHGFPQNQGQCQDAPVRARRKHLGISQEELAERAGLHRTYVADVERGARNLSLGSIEKLAYALEISIPILFFHAGGVLNQSADRVVDILLVEDDPEEVAQTLKAFEKANLSNRVHVVRDGAEALEFVFCTGRHAGRKMEDRPQIILLDLKLPKVSGLEVLRQIKANTQTRGIPVVMLASSQRQQNLAESLKLGAETCILKPVDFNRFAGIVPRLQLCWALLHLMASAPAVGSMR